MKLTTVEDCRIQETMKDYFVLLGDNQLLWGQVCKLRKHGYDIPSDSRSVCETDIAKFFDLRVMVLFENHDWLFAIYERRAA